MEYADNHVKFAPTSENILYFKDFVSWTSSRLADFAFRVVAVQIHQHKGRRSGRAVANEGEICEGLPVSGVLWHYWRAPCGPDSLWLGTLGTETTFKHGHYVESADIVTARYQGLASWSFDLGLEGEVEEGGVIAHLTESPD